MFTNEFLAMITTCTALVMAITQAVKRALKLKGAGAVILSLVVSALVCLVQEVQAGFSLVPYLFLVVAVFLSANGWYNFAEQMMEKR